MVYGRDADAAHTVVISTGVTFVPSGLTLAGTAIGMDEYMSQAFEARCNKARKYIAAMEECDLPTQHACTILQGFLQRHSDFVLRVTP